MATGDITSVTVGADGWYIDIDVEGFDTDMSVDLGSGDGEVLDYDDIESATIVLTVVSHGYDSTGTLGTITRTLYGTSTVRKPTPDEADIQQSETAGGAQIRIALSDFIYADDDSGGGGSGTDPLIAISAGCISDGGSASTNNVETAFTVTNSSTLDYPKVIGQWDNVAGTRHASRVTDTFTLAANCFHRLGIAAVKFVATGGTSSNEETAIVTSQTATERSVTGLYASAYQTDIAISDMTQEESIDCRFIAYPVVGDAAAVLDTDDYTTANEEVRGYNKATMICDKDNALSMYAVVDESGNDGSGVVSATLASAEAAPYATIAEAYEDGANLIYLNAGTYPLLGSTPASRVTSSEWITVQPHPTAGTKATCIVSIESANKNYKCERLCYSNLTIGLTNTSSYMNGEDDGNYLWFKDCTFDSGEVGAPLTGPGYRSHGCYFDNCGGDMGRANWEMHSFSTSRAAFQFDGCTFEDDNTSDNGCDVWYRVVACSQTSSWVIGYKPSSVSAPPTQDGLIIAYNVFLGGNDTGNPVCCIAEVDNITHGIAIVNNVFERRSSSGEKLLCVSGDSADTTTEHVIIWHNVFAGARCNLGYNDAGSTGYDQLNWSFKFNSLLHFNNKDDTFGTPNANRIGGWPVGYAIGFLSNNYTNEIGTFPGEYDGFDLTVGDPGYTEDKSSTGDGEGGGDYTLTAESTLKDRREAGQSVIEYDFRGYTILDDTVGDIGAYPGVYVAPEQGFQQRPTVNDLNVIYRSAGSLDYAKSINNNEYYKWLSIPEPTGVDIHGTHTGNSSSVSATFDTDAALNPNFFYLSRGGQFPRTNG